MYGSRERRRRESRRVVAWAVGYWLLVFVATSVMLGLLVLATSACGPGRAALCDLVNHGSLYRYNSELDRFEVAPDVSDAFAGRPELALACGGALSDDWAVEPAGRGWLDYTHTDAGDVLIAVNDEVDPDAMLAQVQRSAELGLEMSVVLERNGVEYRETVAWRIENR